MFKVRLVLRPHGRDLLDVMSEMKKQRAKLRTSFPPMFNSDCPINVVWTPALPHNVAFVAMKHSPPWEGIAMVLFILWIFNQDQSLSPLS